jgi:hypothetical protein
LQLLLSTFFAFNEQLAILQRTATTALILQLGAKTSGRNHLIDSGSGNMRNCLQRKTLLNYAVYFDGVFLQNPPNQRNQFIIESPPVCNIVAFKQVI